MWINCAVTVRKWVHKRQEIEISFGCHMVGLGSVAQVVHRPQVVECDRQDVRKTAV